MQVGFSHWRDASVEITGDTIFAVGDVHGCASQLNLLLDEIASVAKHVPHPRLVFLGDLISKGPRSLAVLDVWASTDLDDQYKAVHRLFGNHEQLLMIIVNDLPNASSAEEKLMSVGGDKFVDELRAQTNDQSSPLSRDLLKAGTSEAVLVRLDQLQGHVQIGNVVFVHAGIDPALGVSASLAAPWTDFGGNHWAWIADPFLQHRGGYAGQVIVHGHMPPEQHRECTGYPDPHVIQHDRLCLDGGSSTTGIVMGAQVEDGRYRLIYAHS